MRGVFDLLSPDAWISEQRAAVAGDVSYQRAALTADLRRTADEATTNAAIKFAIAGVATVAISIAIWRLSSRGSR